MNHTAPSAVPASETGLSEVMLQLGQQARAASAHMAKASAAAKNQTLLGLARL